MRSPLDARVADVFRGAVNPADIDIDYRFYGTGGAVLAGNAPDPLDPCSLIRSENAGPFTLTFDFTCHDHASYEDVVVRRPAVRPAHGHGGHCGMTSAEPGSADNSGRTAHRRSSPPELPDTGPTTGRNISHDHGTCDRDAGPQ
ncbi:DUF4387 family protein [Streptomyces sp. NPDC007084]|uniref:DUF4387 family protein n=1 Tax=Streptomyces sp. NPDC007084 TaxID=3154313 RepID=UPI003456E7FC